MVKHPNQGPRFQQRRHCCLRISPSKGH